MTCVTKVSAKGAIVIPKEIRDAEGLQPGSKVAFVRYAGGVNIVRVPDDSIAASHGFLCDCSPLNSGPSVREELIEEHRTEVEMQE